MKLYNTYIKTWRNWLSIDGRSNRKEYWNFVLITVAIFLIFGQILNFFEVSEASATPMIALILTPSIICHLCLSIRRFHDSDRSGYWLFFNLIPFIGNLITWYFLGIHPGNSSENKFGHSI